MVDNRLTIGFDFLPVVPGDMGGMLSHVEGLVDGLRRLDFDGEFVAFLNRESEDHFDFPPEFTVVNTGVSGSFRPARYTYEQSVLAVQAARYDVDVLHCPGYVVPLASPVPTVVTVHDMNYERIPENFSTLSRFVWSQLVPRSLKRAKQAITVSEFSRREIVECVDVLPAKVSVVPNAPAPDLPEPNQSLGAVDADVTEPYVLYVGTTHPHKNHVALVEALPELPEDVSLVFVGPERSAHSDIRRTVDDLGVGDRVVTCGYVSKRTLATLYHHATVYAHPSKYEGFGMPVLEAMYYGTPVVCSNAASLPDVGGDAVKYFDPDDPADIADVLSSVLQSIEERAELIDRGNERVREFSWARIAEKTVDVCRIAANGH